MMKKIMSLWKQSLKIWKKKGMPRNLIVLGCGIFVFTGMLASVLVVRRVWTMEKPATEYPPTVLIATHRHPLTGTLLSEPLKILPQVFGVMIENAADAWPLSGIDEAFLVIETPVEGNIPRFIAFFSEDQDVKKIGPVRSARSYYLDWNAEFRGIYGHVGGSPDALANIAKDETLDLNQFFQDEYYYRDELTRYAPHNVYTNTDLLKDSISEIRKKYSVEAPVYDSWKFAEGASESANSDTTHITWGNGYDIDWTYESTSNTYHRSQGGNTYTANNVVIIATAIGMIPGDDKGRRTIRTIGEGKMTLLHNGISTSGAWKKLSASDRIRFYDSTGNEIVMNAGKTWIEVIDDLEKTSTTSLRE